MIKFILKETLETKEKTMYWLAANTGITYPTIHKITNNQTNAIRFEILDKICTALECEITDIISFKPS